MSGFSFELKEKPLLKSKICNNEIPRSKIIQSTLVSFFMTLSNSLNFSLQNMKRFFLEAVDY